MNEDITLVTKLNEEPDQPLESFFKIDTQHSPRIIAWIRSENAMPPDVPDHNACIVIRRLNVSVIRNYIPNLGPNDGCLEHISPLLLLREAAQEDPFDTHYFIWFEAQQIKLLLEQKSGSKVWEQLESSFRTSKAFLVTKFKDVGGPQKEAQKRNQIMFGGSKNTINQITNLFIHYYVQIVNQRLIVEPLQVFTLIKTKFRPLINIHSVATLTHLIHTSKRKRRGKAFTNIKAILYVISYNAPLQFAMLLNSFGVSDKAFLTKPRKILINNSTDESTQEQYDKLCQDYGFEQIKKCNIGISGARQFISEHFATTNSDYYVCFEDDMLLHPRTELLEGSCTALANLYDKSMYITHEFKLDFLKLSFKEVIGDNSSQWAWYTITDGERSKYFPEHAVTPFIELDSDIPKVEFKNILSKKGLNFAVGDVYYSNWPAWFSREGNRKIFLSKKTKTVSEKHWMREVFKNHKKGKLKAGVLLSSPINHNRIVKYNYHERKES